MKKNTLKKDVVVDELTTKILENYNFLKEGDTIEGFVLAITNTAVYIDLGAMGTGIIYGIEYINVRDLIKKMNIGDTISAKVILKENKDGYIDLSLKEAKHALVWNEAELIAKEKRTLSLVIKEANKGGLIIEWNGINGFLPSSQLKGDNYPKVNEDEKDKIITELKKLVGKRLSVQIIAAIPKEGKIIFSEVSDSLSENNSSNKNSDSKKTKSKNSVSKMVGKYNIGDKLDGIVTGLVDFGIFVKVNDDFEGLVHKSEIAWGLVENVKDYAKVGDKIKVEIIEIKDDKISLSIKKLLENPWTTASKKYKNGDIVSGVVIRFNRYGALVSVEEGVAGLIHISDFPNEETMKEHLSLGKVYKFEITFFDSKEEKMTLKLKK